MSPGCCSSLLPCTPACPPALEGVGEWRLLVAHRWSGCPAPRSTRRRCATPAAAARRRARGPCRWRRWPQSRCCSPKWRALPAPAGGAGTTQSRSRPPAHTSDNTDTSSRSTHVSRRALSLSSTPTMLPGRLRVLLLLPPPLDPAALPKPKPSIHHPLSYSSAPVLTHLPEEVGGDVQGAQLPARATADGHLQALGVLTPATSSRAADRQRAAGGEERASPVDASDQPAGRAGWLAGWLDCCSPESAILEVQHLQVGEVHQVRHERRQRAGAATMPRQQPRQPANTTRAGRERRLSTVRIDQETAGLAYRVYLLQVQHRSTGAACRACSR